MDSSPIQSDKTPSPPLPSVTLPTAATGKLYVRAVTPGLRKLLYVVFALLALLGANSVYLVAITAMEALNQQTYQNYFYQLMFLGHLVLGLLVIVPFVVFGTKHMLYAKDRRNPVIRGSDFGCEICTRIQPAIARATVGRAGASRRC